MCKYISEYQLPCRSRKEEISDKSFLVSIWTPVASLIRVILLVTKKKKKIKSCLPHEVFPSYLSTVCLHYVKTEYGQSIATHTHVCKASSTLTLKAIYLWTEAAFHDNMDSLPPELHVMSIPNTSRHMTPVTSALWKTEWG